MINNFVSGFPLTHGVGNIGIKDFLKFSAAKIDITSGGFRISPRRTPTPRGGGGAPTYDFAKIS